MKVTREVVLDLLPLYLSGEASADSRALIVDHPLEIGAVALLAIGGWSAYLLVKRRLRSLL